MSAAVSSSQRYIGNRRCPICGGCERDPRGQEKRCTGFLSSDGDYLHCSREEYAGSIKPSGGKNCEPTFGHRRNGSCKCGVQHGEDRPERNGSREVVARYVYQTAEGAPLFRVVRTAAKDFYQQHPDPSAPDGWATGRNGVALTLYKLPDLLADDQDRPVYIVEGEKDVETMWKHGHVATCNPMGAGKWHFVADVAKTVLQGRDVVVIADDDDEKTNPPYKGQKHARDVYRSLVGVARSIRIVRSTKGKDISDHFAAGGTLDELVPLEDERASESPEAPTSQTDRLAPILTPEQFFELEEEADLVVPALGIGSGPPTGFVGESYCGKTLASMAMGLSVVAGLPVWGKWACKSGVWLHLDHEQGRRHTKRRIKRIAYGLGISEERLLEMLVQRRIRLAIYPQLNLTTPDARDHYKRLFEGVTLVTCDSLRPMIGDVDENSSQVRPLIAILSAASDETGAAVGQIHHAGNPPPEGSNRTRKHMGRGSTSITDEWQSKFVMSKRKGDAVSLVTHEKDRELGETVEDFGLRIVDVAGPDGHPKWGLRVEYVEGGQPKPVAQADRFKATLARVRDCIGANPGIGGADAVLVRIGGAANEVRQAVRELVESGEATSTPTGKGKGVRLSLATKPPHWTETDQ